MVSVILEFNKIREILQDKLWQKEKDIFSSKTSDWEGEFLSGGIQSSESWYFGAVLSVFLDNWMIVGSEHFLTEPLKENVSKLIEFENSWNNDLKKYTKDSICAVLDAFSSLAIFLEDVNAEAKIEKLKSMISFIPDSEFLEDNSTLSTKKVERVSEIVPGSVVCLKSNENEVGAVLSINGDILTVMLGRQRKTFYREQVKLVLEEQEENITLKDARIALTAHQIGNPGNSNLYSLNSARIEFVPYQFRPALKMIKSETPRILVADDVGVGKTIESGLILKEMEARAGIKSVLIICPRPLVVEHKWREEMKRFDEDFLEADGALLNELIDQYYTTGEWNDRYSKLIISYSLFNESIVAGTAEKGAKKLLKKGLSELDPFPHFDLVIVDEAHHIRNSATWMHKGVELFCSNADAVVFLTATPLQNGNEDLYSLLHVLRPDFVFDKETFSHLIEPNRYINLLLSTVRQQKDDWQEEATSLLNAALSTGYGKSALIHNPQIDFIRDMLSRNTMTREEKVKLMGVIESLHTLHSIINRTRRRDIDDFCIRRSITVNSSFTETQQALYDAVMSFEEYILSTIHRTTNTAFMMCTIKRQASSCLYGLAPFLKDFVEKRLSQLEQDGEFYDSDYNFSDKDFLYIEDLAKEIVTLSQRLTDDDPKFDKMYEIILQKLTEENNKTIIFSSFRHTLGYLKNKLLQRQIRVGQIDGSVDDDERRDLSRRFKLKKDDPDALDVLLFTEVGCEGLDYQFCDTMINYDLPWNPMRIEQRIGRIDRKGQKSDTVKIYNMITNGTIDAVIYDRCLSKIGVFKESIGDCSEILGSINDQITKIMFEPGLTEEERIIKLEKIADNEVMKIQELRTLEQDEKSLFGFDLSSYMIDKEVQEAENIWISAESIQELVSAYFNDLLGEGEYIKGKNQLKQLRLSSDKKHVLLNELKRLEYVNINKAYYKWIQYLQATKSFISVTFDGKCASENQDSIFLTQMHPLVRQAANRRKIEAVNTIGVKVISNEMPRGDYPFVVSSWEYKGLRPDIKLKTVSKEQLIEKKLFKLIKTGVNYSYNLDDLIKEQWLDLENKQHQQWLIERKSYKEEVKKESDYRKSQLETQKKYRLENIEKRYGEILESQINRTRMKQSQIEKLINEISWKIDDCDKAILNADIVSTILFKGILHVENFKEN